MLSADKYIQAIELTQIVSIDLIILNKQADSTEILVGKRVNEPAKDTWFVPGGRVYKNEILEDAIKRVSKMELGYEINYDETEKLGIYDHIYSNNFGNIKDDNGNMINTHYVVIALVCCLETDKLDFEQFKEQHDDCKLMSIDELLERDDVHKYTEKYALDMK